MTATWRSWIDWPFVPTRHLALFLAAISILMLGHLLGVFFAWWYRRHHGAAGRRSRFGGMMFGIVQGVMLSTLVLAALLAIERPARIGLSMIMDHNALAHRAYDQLVRLRHLADSTAVGRKPSSLSAAQREVLEMGGSLAIISKYEGALDNLKRNEMIVHLIEKNPAIDPIEREIRNDRTLKAAVRAGICKQF